MVLNQLLEKRYDSATDKAFILSSEHYAQVVQHLLAIQDTGFIQRVC